MTVAGLKATLEERGERENEEVREELANHLIERENDVEDACD